MYMFCRSLFVLFFLASVLSVLLRYTDSDYPFGIFKLFSQRNLITTTCLSYFYPKLFFSFLYLLIVLSVYITFLLPWFYHFLLIFFITSWYLLTFHSNRFKITQMVNIVWLTTSLELPDSEWLVNSEDQQRCQVSM